MYYSTLEVAQLLPMSMEIVDHYLDKNSFFNKNIEISNSTFDIGFKWRKEDDNELILFFYIIERDKYEILVEDVISYNLKDKTLEELDIAFSYYIFKSFKTSDKNDIERSIDENKDKRILCELIEKYTKNTTKIIASKLQEEIKKF